METFIQGASRSPPGLVCVQLYLSTCCFFWLWLWLWLLLATRFFRHGCNQFKICVGSLFVEFCTTLKHFVNKVPPLGCFLAPFWTLGVIFGAILNPWGHFWSTLFTFFGVKKTLWRQRCPRSASKRKAAFRTHVLKLFWGSFLVIFQFFSWQCW